MPFPILKHKNFRNLWIGQAVSQFGDAVYGLLFIFMTDKITQNPAMVGLVAGATAVPFLVVSPFAGVLADRADRRSIMLSADLVSAVILALFAALLLSRPTPPIWSLFATPFLLSSVNAFFLPAKGAAIPSLVPRENLLEANSLSSATQNLMHTVGLMLAALLLGPVEAIAPTKFFVVAIIVNLLTFLVSAVFVSRLPKLPAIDKPHENSHPMDDFKAGFELVANHKVLKALFASNVIVSLAVSGFMVVYTATNRAWFDGKFSTLAWIELAFLVALVIGSLIVPRFKTSRIGYTYAIGLAVVGLAVVGLGWARTAPLYILGNIIAGLALPFVNIPFMTYVSLAVPPEFRGRVNSFLTMISSGVQPLGSAVSGTGLKIFGLVGMYGAMGGAMTVSALTPLASKAVRDEVIPTEPKQS